MSCAHLLPVREHEGLADGVLPNGSNGDWTLPWGLKNNLLIIYDYMGMDQIAYEIPFCWSISRCSMFFLTLTNSIPTVSGKIMGYTGNYHAIWWYHVISHFRGWRSPNPGDRNRRTVIPRRSSNTAQGCLDVRYSWLMGCPTTGYNML